MAKCLRTINLVVHYKNKSGGTGINNAIVLCKRCYEAVIKKEGPGVSPVPFSDNTKQLALLFANHHCECTSKEGCH